MLRPSTCCLTLFALALGLVALAVPASAQEVICALPTRADVEAAVESGATQDDLDALLNNCQPVAAPATVTGGLESVTAAQQTTPTGNTFWEAIDSCGYHPQRREFDCSVEVRQPSGYGGTPPPLPPNPGPGTFEWMIACVDYGAGLVPVGISAVHVHDEPFGVAPPWYYGVVIQADRVLHATPVNGRTLRARAILSWTFTPTGCNYIPIWGNQADFQIKLDP